MSATVLDWELRGAGFRVSGLGLEEEKVGRGGASSALRSWGNRDIRVVGLIGISHVPL